MSLWSWIRKPEGVVINGEDTKKLRRALELTKQRIEIDKELNALRPEAQKILHKMNVSSVDITGQGSVAIKFNTHKVIDCNKLATYLQQNPSLLVKYVSDLSIVKHGALERYLGTPEYAKMVSNTETTDSVVFIVK